MNNLYKSLILIFIITFESCISNKYASKEEIISDPLYRLINSRISNQVAPDYNKKIKVIHLLFYNIDKNSFLILSTADGYSLRKVKSHTQINDILLVYNGFNDSIAKRYLNLNKMSTTQIDSVYINYDKFDSGYDPQFPPNYYRIGKDGEFKKIIPNKKHLDILKSLFIKYGYEIIPPPPPIE